MESLQPHSSDPGQPSEHLMPSSPTSSGSTPELQSNAFSPTPMTHDTAIEEIAICTGPWGVLYLFFPELWNFWYACKLCMQGSRLFILLPARLCWPFLYRLVINKAFGCWWFFFFEGVVRNVIYVHFFFSFEKKKKGHLDGQLLSSHPRLHHRWPFSWNLIDQRSRVQNDGTFVRWLISSSQFSVDDLYQKIITCVRESLLRSFLLTFRLGCIDNEVSAQLLCWVLGPCWRLKLG